MADVVLHCARRLPEALQPGNYLFCTQLEPDNLSLYLGLAVGLVDCILKQSPDSARHDQLMTIIKSCFIDSLSHQCTGADDRREVESYVDAWVTGAFVQELRRPSSTRYIALEVIAMTIKIDLGGTFLDLTTQLSDGSELTVEEFGSLLEAVAMLWEVQIRLFSESSVTNYGTGAELIVLVRKEHNEIGLVYDEDTYRKFVLPYEHESREGAQLVHNAAKEFCRLLERLKNRMDRHESRRSEGELLEDAFVEGQCFCCREPVNSPPIKRCRGHLVCDSCLVHHLSFGLLGCPVVTCTEALTDEGIETLVALSRQKNGTITLPLGEFICEFCKQRRFWYSRASCRCNLCRDCKTACFCDGPSSCEVECSKCNRPAIDPFITPCGHIFCHSCAWVQFYDSNICMACGTECVLTDIEPAIGIESRVSSDNPRTQLVHTLASLLLCPHPTVTNLGTSLQAYLEERLTLVESHVGTLCRLAECAKYLAARECAHYGETMLCNCSKRHCLSCLLDTKELVEERDLPLLCRCGVLLDEPTVKNLFCLNALFR